MKKMFLVLAAALVSVAAMGQGMGVSVEKVDVAKLRAAIAKSDGEIADAKKNTKAATWLKRGDVLLDAEGKPTNGLYVGMPENILVLSYGEVAPTETTVGGTPYKLYTYADFKAYINADNLLDFYVPTTIVDPTALDKAYDAFAKAYELDAKQSRRVAQGMTDIHSRSVERAGALYMVEQYATAADDFCRAYRASVHPSMAGRTDTMSLYYAGMANVLAERYDMALERLDMALDKYDYEQEGDTYRMKFLAMYNLGEREPALAVLKQGLAKWPGNEALIDITMRYYAENEGDPSDIIPLVQEAIAANPNSPALYQGLARVYDKLGDSDNAIAAIRSAVRLTPNDFLSNYLEGLFIVQKGDAMNAELGKMTITSRAQYQEALDKVNGVFAEALFPLEKAYELNPEEGATVELLKNLTFRLRDDAAINAKYEKYNALFEALQ